MSNHKNAVLLSKVEPNENIYEGVAVGGRVIFKGQGHKIFVRMPQHGETAKIGESAVFALGLTECCARLRRGKVYFYPGIPESQTTQVSKWLASLGINAAHRRRPQMLYVDHIWTESEADDWFQKAHLQRLTLLNGKAGAISGIEPVLPIHLQFDEKKEYPELVVAPGYAGAAYIHADVGGAFYLDWLDTIKVEGAYYAGNTASFYPHFVVKKSAVTAFRMTSADNAVQKLQTMFAEDPDQHLYTYNEITAETVIAHDHRVAAGYGKFTQDAAVKGDRLQRYNDAVDRHQNEVRAVFEVLELFGGIIGWPREELHVGQAYFDVADKGVATCSMFMLDDQSWIRLSLDKKKQLIRFWELRRRAGVPVRRTLPAQAEPITGDQTLDQTLEDNQTGGPGDEESSEDELGQEDVRTARNLPTRAARNRGIVDVDDDDDEDDVMGGA